MCDALLGRHLVHELLEREEEAEHELLVLFRVVRRRGPAPLAVVQAGAFTVEEVHTVRHHHCRKIRFVGMSDTPSLLSPPKPWERAGMVTSAAANAPAPACNYQQQDDLQQRPSAAPTAAPPPPQHHHHHHQSQPYGQQSAAAPPPPPRPAPFASSRFGTPYTPYGSGGYPPSFFGSPPYGASAGYGPYAGGGPFGAWLNPDKDAMPPGLRQIEEILFSIGRITQMLEMNLEVLQHFLNSLSSLYERLHSMYTRSRSLTASVRRQSLEFGRGSLSTALHAHSHLRRNPLAALGVISVVFGLLVKFLRPRPRRALTQNSEVAFAEALRSVHSPQ